MLVLISLDRKYLAQIRKGGVWVEWLSGREDGKGPYEWPRYYTRTARRGQARIGYQKLRCQGGFTLRQHCIIAHCTSLAAAGGFAGPVVGNTGSGSQEWRIDGRATGGGQLVGVRRGCTLSKSQYDDCFSLRQFLKK